MEAWEAPNHVGKRVRVVRPITETERNLLGREYVLERMTKPHGYAVCRDETGSWWLHPESLEVVE